MIERTTEPASIVPRVPAEASPAAREPEAAQIDLSKLAEIAAPFFRQVHDQNMAELREEARGQMDLRRLELEHAAREADRERESRKALSADATKVALADGSRRFRLSLVVMIGALLLAGGMIVAGHIANVGFLLLALTSVVVALVNRTPAPPSPKSPDET